MRTVLLLAPLALAACDVQIDDQSRNDGKDVSIRLASGKAGAGSDDRVSLSVPGLSADLKLPALDLSEHVNIDDVSLAPGTKVSSLDVKGGEDAGEGEDTVRIAFTNAGAPATVIDHYRRELAKAGYSIEGGGAATGLTARRGDKTLTLGIAGEGTGSKGTLTLVKDRG